MQPITEKELETIRENQEVFMPQRAIIQRKRTLAKGEFGWRNVDIDVRARCTAGFGRFSIIADRYSGIIPCVWSFPAQTDIEVADRIIDENSIIYEVREIRRPKSYLTATQVLADRVND
jgi:hypothetical protein